MSENPYRKPVYGVQVGHTRVASYSASPDPREEAWNEGFAAGRAAATPPHEDPLDPHDGPAPLIAEDEGWSPGIDDPEPRALGDIETGEGWYQT